MTHTPPLRLCLEELLIIEYIKIIRKPEDNALCQLVTSLRVDQTFMNHSRKSPLQHMFAVTKQASKFKVDTYNVETRLPVTKESLLLPILALDKRPWTGLGSSKDRTPHQINLAKELLSEALDENSHNTVVVFTDGSALNNPGPCGTAAIIHGRHSDPFIIRKAVSPFSNSYHGELKAITLATIIHPNGRHSDPIIIRKAVPPFSNSYHGELKAIALAVEHTVMLSTRQHIGDLHIVSDCHASQVKIILS